MVRELQEFLHFVAQQMIFFLTLAQLLIFVAMGSLFRGKRNSPPRYIAGALQLFVINGIAWYSALWGFIAFLATYALFLSGTTNPDRGCCSNWLSQATRMPLSLRLATKP